MMEIKNKNLINMISKYRNNITTGHNALVFHNIHSANNDIKIIGERDSLLLEGKESYIRSSTITINGNDNNVVIEDKSILSDGCSIKITGNNNQVSIGADCRFLRMSIFIFGNDNHIIIDNNVSSVLTSLHIEDNGNTIIIGQGTTMHGRENNLVELALDEKTTIKIGKDCMISNSVHIRSSDSHSVLNEKGERINSAGNIIIKDHVWIGMRSIVLKNTIIHDNCIIGAGSVCNKDYEKENCLIAGNPAKTVKENVNWSRDRL